MTAYRWSGPLASYGKMTGDRRIIDAGALTSRNTPLPLRYGLLGTHDPTVSVGAINTINMATNPVSGTGVFLPVDVEPMVKVAMYKAAMGIAQPSVDLEPGTMEMAIGDHEGKRVLRISKAHVMGATLVSFPAFADQPLDVSMDPDAQLPMPFESLVASAAEALGWTIEEIPDEEAIALVASIKYDVDEPVVMEDGLVAGGGPLAPSKHYFEDPQLTGPKPLTVTPDGRVFGLLAQWNVCHTGVANSCVLAPHSKTNYAKFHQGTVVTSEGDEIRVGKITLGAGHADTKLGLIPASEHYDNTATATAVVRAGECEFGIWVSGVLLPGVSAERIAELRRSPLSGDWRLDRSVNNLELIAALAVNSPGFPIFEIVAGAQVSLVAAGMVMADVEELEELEAFEVAEVDTGQEERRAKLEALIEAQNEREQARRAARLAALSGGEK